MPPSQIQLVITAQNQAQGALAALQGQLAAVRGQAAAAGSSGAGLGSVFTGMARAAGPAASSIASIVAAATPMAAAAAAGTVAVLGLKSAFDAVTSVVGGVAKAMFEGNAAIAAQERAFQTLLGPTADYKQVIKDLIALDIKTPFSAMDLTKLGRDLAVANVPAEELTGTIMALGNQMAVMGPISSEQLSRVGLALKQVAAAGRVQGDELNQLSENGIRAIDALAFAFGKSTAEIVEMKEKGEISSKMLIFALQKFGTEAPQNIGALENSVTTLSGAWDMATSTFQSFIVQAGKPFYDVIEKNGVALLKLATSEPVMEFLERLKAGLAFVGNLLGNELIPKVQEWIQSFVENEGVQNWFKGLVTVVSGSATAIFGALDLLVRVAGTSAEYMAKSIDGVAKIFRTATGAMATNVAGVIGIIKRIISGDFAGAWNQAGKLIAKNKDTVGELGDSFGDLFSTVGEGWSKQRENFQLAAGDLEGLKKALSAPVVLPDPKLKTGARPADILDPKKVEAFAKAWNKSVEDEVEALQKIARQEAEIRSDLADRVNEIEQKAAEKRSEILKVEVKAQAETAKKIGEIRAALPEKLTELQNNYLDRINELNTQEAQLAAETAVKIEQIRADAAAEAVKIGQEAADRRAAIEQEAASKITEIQGAAAERQKELNAAREAAQEALATRLGEMQEKFEEEFAEKRARIRERSLEQLRRLEETEVKTRADFEKDAVEKRLQTIENLELEMGKKQRRGEDTSGLEKEKALRLADLADEEKVERQRMDRKLARMREEAEAAAKVEEQRALESLKTEEDNERKKLEALKKAEEDKTRAAVAEMEKREREAQKQDEARVREIENKKDADIRAVQEAADKDIEAARQRADKAIEGLGRVAADRADKTLVELDRLKTEYEAAVKSETDKASQAIAELTRLDGERNLKAAAQIQRIDDEAKHDIEKAVGVANERIAEMERSRLEILLKSENLRNGLVEDNKKIADSYGLVKTKVDDLKAAMEALSKVPPPTMPGGVPEQKSEATMGAAAKNAVAGLSVTGANSQAFNIVLGPGGRQPQGTSMSGGSFTPAGNYNTPRGMGPRSTFAIAEVANSDWIVPVGRRQFNSGGTGMTVNVTVQGSVISERELKEEIRNHLTRIQRRGSVI